MLKCFYFFKATLRKKSPNLRVYCYCSDHLLWPVWLHFIHSYVFFVRMVSCSTFLKTPLMINVQTISIITSKSMFNS